MRITCLGRALGKTGAPRLAPEAPFPAYVRAACMLTILKNVGPSFSFPNSQPHNPTLPLDSQPRAQKREGAGGLDEKQSTHRAWHLHPKKGHTEDPSLATCALQKTHRRWG